MFAAAVAVSEGKIPNKDVFAQYGPLAPLIQGMWLKIFGIELINLRVLTAFLIAITAAYIFTLTKSRLGISTAFLLQFFWVVSQPRLPLPPTLPWASVISTLLILIAIHNFRIVQDSKYVRWKPLILVGAALALLPLLRVQIGIFTLLILINWTSLYFRRKISVSAYLSLALSTLITLVLTFVLFHSFGMIESYILQCLEWPSKFYGNAYLPTIIFTKDGLVYWSTWYYYPFLYVIFRSFLSHRWNFLFKQLPLRRFNHILLPLLIVVFGIFSMFFYSYDVNPKSYLNPFLQFQWLLQRSVIGLFYFLAFDRFIRALRGFRSFSLSSNYFEPILATSAIAQLYPGSDPLHLWWIAPVLLVTFFSPGNKIFPQYSVDARKLRGYLLYVSVLLTLILVQYLSIARVSFESSILHGMYSQAEVRNRIEPMLSSIIQTRRLYPNNELVFDCHDGLFSVADGTYLPRDKNFVNWSPEFNVVTTSGDIVVVCSLDSVRLHSRYPYEEFSIIHQIPVGPDSLFSVLQRK
jgi:hypothetical protein